MAFWIDASWAGRQDDQDVASLVDLLVADIEADVGDLTRWAAFGDSIIEAVDQSLAAGLGAPDAPELVDLPTLVQMTWSTAQTDPSLSAFGVVQGSDAWNRIPASIKVSLSDYMQGPFAVDRSRDLEAVNRLLAISSRYGGMVSVAVLDLGVKWSPEQNLAYLQDPEVQTWLSIHKALLSLERSWQLQWIEGLPRVAADLRAVR